LGVEIVKCLRFCLSDESLNKRIELKIKPDEDVADDLLIVQALALATTIALVKPFIWE
jgi:hypothetical protein